jgi:hypothetical protein
MFKAQNNTQLQIQIKPSLKNGFEDSEIKEYVA